MVPEDPLPSSESEGSRAGSVGTGETVAKKRKPLDHGKIMALHNAGWSNKAIADEMKITSQAVGQVIYRMKEKEERIHGKKQGD